MQCCNESLWHRRTCTDSGIFLQLYSKPILSCRGHAEAHGLIGTQNTPDSARVIGVIVAGAILNLAVQPLDTPSHGVRVVDVNVVVLSTHRLFHKWLLYLHACAK